MLCGYGLPSLIGCAVPLHRRAKNGSERSPCSEQAQNQQPWDADALRLTINNGCKHTSLQRTTINILWEHYSREELPLKALSTQDSYLMYAKNWIVPRWGNVYLEQVKTVEVERWLRATGVANGTKAKIKCVMSALFSHAVRWEFCGHNPISSGVPVETGGKRGPSAGVRVCAKRQKSPLKLTAEQVALVLTKLKFRDQLHVPGCRVGNTSRRTGRAPLDGLRFRQPDLRHPAFLLLAPGRASCRHKVGGFGSAASDASGSQRWPSGVEITESLQPVRRLRLCFGKAQGSQAPRFGCRAEKEDSARVQKHWNHGRRMAYGSTHRGNNVSRDGGTPTHDPRLLAAQQPSRHE